jgi:hypothetical protein
VIAGIEGEVDGVTIVNKDGSWRRRWEVKLCTIVISARPNIKIVGIQVKWNMEVAGRMRAAAKKERRKKKESRLMEV